MDPGNQSPGYYVRPSQRTVVCAREERDRGGGGEIDRERMRERERERASERERERERGRRRSSHDEYEVLDGGQVCPEYLLCSTVHYQVQGCRGLQMLGCE